MGKSANVSKKSKVSFFVILLAVVLTLYAITLLLPMFWGFINSFKGDYSDFYKNKLGLPKKWLFSNYTTAFQNFETKVMTLDVPPKPIWVGFWQMVKNSLFYAIGCSFFSTLIPCITGYAMAKFRYKFSSLLYIVVLFTMALPVVGNLASEINVARTLGVYDSFVGMWIMSANFAGQYTLVFYATFRCIPDGFSEAAEIDGANELVIMIKILMPLVVNTFGAIMLIKFISYWNEYESAMIYLRTHPTIAYGLYSLNGNTVRGMNGVPMRLTGCMILFIPVLIVFLLFQDKLMGNVSMGGIKG